MSTEPVGQGNAELLKRASMCPRRLGVGDQGRVAVAGQGGLFDHVELRAALVNVAGTDGPSDALTFNALDGDDTVDATGLAPGVVGLTVNGGAGTDVLSGGPGTVLIQ